MALQGGPWFICGFLPCFCNFNGFNFRFIMVLPPLKSFFESRTSPYRTGLIKQYKLYQHLGKILKKFNRYFSNVQMDKIALKFSKIRKCSAFWTSLIYRNRGVQWEQLESCPYLVFIDWNFSLDCNSESF